MADPLTPEEALTTLDDIIAHVATWPPAGDGFLDNLRAVRATLDALAAASQGDEGLRAALERAQTQLRRWEWGAFEQEGAPEEDGFIVDHCPECLGRYPRHKPGCALRAALDAEEERA